MASDVLKKGHSIFVITVVVPQLSFVIPQPFSSKNKLPLYTVDSRIVTVNVEGGPENNRCMRPKQ